MNSLLSLYAIVVCYNGKRWLEKCLTSLQVSEYPVSIIVVDNDSTDGSVELIKQYFPDVKLIQSKVNLGFGKANNLGIKYALSEKADFIFLLNQDAWVRKDCIGKLLDCFRRNQKAGIVSPVQMDGSGTAIDYKFKQHVSKYLLEGDISSLEKESTNTTAEVAFVNAAAWLIKSECIRQVGGFNPLFPHYGEDNEYAGRIHYHGYKLYVQAGALINHDRDQKEDHFGYLVWKNREYVSFMKHLLNINKSYLSCLWVCIDKFSREVVYFTIKGRLAHVFGEIVASFKVLFSLSTLKRNRENAKKQGAFL
ncbi:glycosyltransferase family 2 protein [Fulvivirga sediminis]|uniref:Glycosyltransferase family 2 protein n=1 Tax=Fulvivirga sediminis TaxID=2803949 RepID=A0A937F7E1_9BACT|nr:glycosyltransferase family 2 protein [Fulvivirga sediminis]MBL3655639.1 glycosyltransferase family 2 protein [Fulvivirga sediminis]